ncbi:response regulator [Stenotrophomonas sp. Sa5BUN4]|uniref:Response regulator n=1 Tax=Stenotrophomonas lacuserhaii TaxID=2760084 RepID=A0A8X8FT10_9GAMM|nr:response regulator [Stenotrophomonas pennii]MBD7954315.1 response regulator [Stenotrophomonas pennii]
MELRIILADDHPIVLIGARAVIESSGVGRVVAEASGTTELLQVLGDHACDVLVTDFAMPGGEQADGIAMLSLIRRRYPALPIVMLSMASNIGILRLVHSIGVLGLIDKSSSLREIPDAILAAKRGQPYICRGITSRLNDFGESDSIAFAGKQPTPKELEVMRLLGTGLTVTEIAAKLNRSVTTISRQKGDAMRKLGVTNEAEFFAFLRSHGLSE